VASTLEFRLLFQNRFVGWGVGPTAGKSVTKIRNRMFKEGYSYVTGVREDSCGFVTKVLTADKTL